MRIQIRVFLDADKDQDCIGARSDFVSSSPTFEDAFEELQSLKLATEDAIKNKKQT